MTNVPATLERVLIHGDLSRLSEEERVFYYKHVCESVGLNPLTKPLAYLNLGQGLVLYAKKDATDQLRKIHGVSIYKIEEKFIGDAYKVTAYARDKEGKEDADEGVVVVKGLIGDKLANAMMKATTKAKRRVTLSICGLGLLDESEIESIPASERIAPSARDNPAQSAEQVAQTPGHHVIGIGKFKGRTISDVDPAELSQYIQWLKKSSADNNKALQGAALALADNGEAYLASLEVSE